MALKKEQTTPYDSPGTRKLCKQGVTRLARRGIADGRIRRE